MKTTVQPIQINVIDNQPVISTLVVAENVIEKESFTKKDISLKNHNIVKTVKNNLSDFEEFGGVEFQILPAYNKLKEDGSINHNAQDITVAELNEQQATLLITYLRNNDKVRAFKKNLVKAFFLMKEKLEGNIQPTVSNHLLEQIIVSNQEMVASNHKNTEVMLQMNKNLETMFKTMLDTNNNMVRLKSEVKESLGSMDKKLEQVESRTKITAEISVRTDKVLGKTYNYLKYQPMTHEERKRLNEKIKERGKILSKRHGLDIEVATSSIYRLLNKQYGLSSYHELEHKDILSAMEWVDFCELGNWEGSVDIHDPLDDVYPDTQRTNGRNIWGDRFLDGDDEDEN